MTERYYSTPNTKMSASLNRKMPIALSVVLLLSLTSLSVTSCKKNAEETSETTETKPEKPKVDYKSHTWEQNNKDGLAALEKNDLETAELAFLAALDQAEAYGRKDVRVATTCNNLASVYEQREMYQQCLPLLNRSQRVFVAVYGTENPAVSTVLASMARVLMKQERFEEASPILIRVIKIQQANPTTKPEVLQDSMLKYSTCLRRMGRAKEGFKWEAAAKQVQTK